jgi:hypothetical protein
MKISKLIEELEKAQARHGDIECLIEVMDDYGYCSVPVDELSYEDREGYGKSIALLQ